MTLEDFLGQWHSPEETLTVSTSGSTGTPKRISVEKRRMLNSARITCDFLQLRRGDNALLCLPLDYIAGKMMVVRSIERGLTLHCTQPSSHPLSPDNRISVGAAAQSLPGGEFPHFTLAAMVPMQVYNSLLVEEERRRLCTIDHLIIGGGSISDELEGKLRQLPNAIWSTYGMTETLSHVALRRINGREASEWYTPFASVGISTVNSRLCIDAPLVVSDGKPLLTNDIAEMHPDGRRFRILGRADNVICSGGIKIQTEQVELQLQPHLTAPFAVTSVPDARFGEAVTLVTTDSNTASVMEICRGVLHPHHVPRHIIFLPSIPQTETGKPARAGIRKAALEILHAER